MNNIIEKEASELLSNYYLDYGMSVITDRSLPDVRDNLKPVQRRILYDSYDLKIFNDKPFKKSARIVGDTLGRFHAHGDSSVYGALCRLNQWFSLKEPLFEPHGNVGKIDGSPASAMRYTETKLSKYGELMLKDLDKNTVDFIPNFDGEEQEPKVLPSAFPNLLVNGNMGMAVGFSTNIPPHNFRDVISQLIYYIDNQECSIEDLVKILKAPDFPTKGQIINPKDMLKLYTNGEGKITIRGKYHIEDEYDEDEKNIINKQNVIIFTEIPFGADINTHKISDIISDCAFGYSKKEKNKKEETFFPPTIQDIKKVTDLTDEIDGIRIKIVVKNKSQVNKVLGLLFKKTPLQSNFNALFNAVKDKKLLDKMSLKQINKEYLDFRKEVIKRRTVFDLDKLNKKRHICEGIIIALDNIDKVVDIIKKSKNKSNAKGNLSKTFNIDTIQSSAIVDMTLGRLTNIEIDNVKQDYDELLKNIKKLENILHSESKLLDVIKEELTEISDKFGKDRETEIIEEAEVKQFSDEELIEDYNCRILLTQEGYIKKHSKQSDNHKLKENDIVLQDFTTTNKSILLLLTNKVNRYKLPVYELDLLTPSSYGQYIPNIIQLEPDEKVIKVVSITDQTKGYIYTAYSNGKLGKVDIKSFISNNKKLQNCYNTDSELLDICYSEKDIDVIMVSSEGKSIIFNTSKINSKQSRNTQGVTSMKLADGLCVVNAKLDVDKDYKIQLETSSNKQKEVYLNDVVSSTDDREMYKYLSLKHGNQGNFIWNMRSYKDEKIAKVTFTK